MEHAKQLHLWSASPTPLTQNWEVDEQKLVPLYLHQKSNGVSGFFIGGTCGEGPWLNRKQLKILWTAWSKNISRDTPLAVQVSDNSASRILENIDEAAEAGARIATMAEPYFLPNANAKNLLRIYSEVCEKSPLPLCLYCRGKNANVRLPEIVLQEILQHDRICAVKDSSSEISKARIITNIAQKRPDLLIFGGDETQCLEYLKLGYHGLLLGGAVFNAPLVMQMFQSWKEHNFKQAEIFDAAIRKLNIDVYGDGHAFWMAGLKYYLWRKGLASSLNHHLGFELPQTLQNNIDRLIAENQL